MPYNCFSGFTLQTFDFSASTAEYPGISSFSVSNSNKLEARIASTRKLRSILYTDVSISNFKPTQIVRTIPKHRLEYNLATIPLDCSSISCSCKIVTTEIINFYLSKISI